MVVRRGSNTEVDAVRNAAHLIYDVHRGPLDIFRASRAWMLWDSILVRTSLQTMMLPCFHLNVYYRAVNIVLIHLQTGENDYFWIDSEFVAS